MTLLQCIAKLLESVTITDKQTQLVSTTYNNLKSILLDEEGGLNGKRVFQNGSYDRDTCIRPLDDVDLFFVLDREEYEDDGKLPNPQTILTNIKNWINKSKDYKDKAKQDRPCVTVHLVDKKFDVLPCFGDDLDGYWIPDYSLKSWMFSNPVVHSEKLTDVNKLRKGLVVPLVRIIKYWNKNNDKIIPSFHIEDIATHVFNLFEMANHEEGVYLWYKYAVDYLDVDKFPSQSDYDTAKEKISNAFVKIDKAHSLYKQEKESEAIKLWKDVFGDKFPTVSVEEVKAMSESMRNGTLKVTSAGILGSIGRTVPHTKYYGDGEK